MKVILICIISLLIFQIYDIKAEHYYQTAKRTCEILYNDKTSPVPAYFPEEFQNCLETAEIDDWWIHWKIPIVAISILILVGGVFGVALILNKKET